MKRTTQGKLVVLAVIVAAVAIVFIRYKLGPNSAEWTQPVARKESAQELRPLDDDPPKQLTGKASEAERIRTAIIETFLQAEPNAIKDVKEADIWFNKSDGIYRIGPWKVDLAKKTILFSGPNGQVTANYKIIDSEIKFFGIEQLRVIKP